VLSEEHVADDDVERCSRDRLERLVDRLSAHDLGAVEREGDAVHLGLVRVVIHEENAKAL
jgi:hypothetical protein